MLASYPANQDLTFYPELTDYDGNPLVPVKSTYSLHGRDGVLATAQPVQIFHVPRPELTVPAALNQPAPDSTKTYRRLEITTQDEKGKTYTTSITYLLTGMAVTDGLSPQFESYPGGSVEPLVPGVNSFALFADLLVLGSDMIQLSVFNNATQPQQISALVQAWANLGQLPVQLADLKGTDSYDKASTRELVEADLNLLSETNRYRLLRAQLIEANDVLGGNPIEARRRKGLISDSAGESAHFFRTSRPLNLPCCRAAIDELRGIVKWGLRVGRS